MDFAWAINALKAGLKITRKAWAGDPPIYLYLGKAGAGNSTIMQSVGTKQDYEWAPPAETVFADDWQVYFGEGHEKQTPEEIEAYKKLMLERMPRGPFSQQMLELGTLKAQQEKADIDKLPKAGSMENCEKLSKAINQLLESIGVMPHLTVTLVPGPEDKELTIAIRTTSENGAANYPIRVDSDMQIIRHEAVACHVVNPDGITRSSIGSPVKSTKTVAGGYEVEDMQSNLGKED